MEIEGNQSSSEGNVREIEGEVRVKWGYCEGKRERKEGIVRMG